MVSQPKNRDDSGVLEAYSIAPKNGSLQLLNRVSTHGAGPCHVNFDRKGNFVLVANCGDGSIAVLPIESDGRLGQATASLQQTGSATDVKRQQFPRAHAIIPSPDNRFILVANLCLDKIFIYKFDPTMGVLTPNGPPFGKVPEGAGVRHLAFHPNGRYLYALNEVDSSVTTFSWDAVRGALMRLDTVSTIPKNWSGNNTAAEIQVHPNGRFVYTSNRNHDSIAVFYVDRSKFTLAALKYEPVGGKTPRSIGLDPTADYLFAANQLTNNVSVFSVNKQTGGLSPTTAGVTAANPLSLDFLRLH